MITPPRGDVSSIPINAAGRKAAEAWNLVGFSSRHLKDYDRALAAQRAGRAFGKTTASRARKTMSRLAYRTSGDGS